MGQEPEVSKQRQSGNLSPPDNCSEAQACSSKINDREVTWMSDWSPRKENGRTETEGQEGRKKHGVRKLSRMRGLRERETRRKRAPKWKESGEEER